MEQEIVDEIDIHKIILENKLLKQKIHFNQLIIQQYEYNILHSFFNKFIHTCKNL